MSPTQGEVWFAALDSTALRPVLVLSVDQVNSSPLRVAIAALIAAEPHPAAVEIRLPALPGHTRRASYVLPSHVHTVTHGQLHRRICQAEPGLVREVVRRLALLTRMDL